LRPRLGEFGCDAHSEPVITKAAFVTIYAIVCIDDFIQYIQRTLCASLTSITAVVEKVNVTRKKGMIIVPHALNLNSNARPWQDPRRRSLRMLRENVPEFVGCHHAFSVHGFTQYLFTSFAAWSKPI
jgi:hypothetical protein